MAKYPGFDVRIIDNFIEVQKRANAYSLRVLYQMGAYTRRTMSRMLSRQPPKALTKTGKLATRYKREVIGKAERAPYSQTGFLHRGVAFEVDKRKRSVRTGPEFRTGDGRVHPSSSTVPALLNSGGAAQVPEREIAFRRTATGGTRTYWRPTGRMLTTKYRAFPFVEPSRDKAIPTFLKKLSKEKL